MANLKKLESIFRIIEHFLQRKEISSYDEVLLKELNCSQRTLLRYLYDIEHIFSSIIKVEKSKKSTWKLVSINEIFEELINTSNDIGYLFSMIKEFDPSIFTYMEKESLKKLLKKDETVFLFKNYIMEELSDTVSKNYFNRLKYAIKNKRIIEIDSLYNKTVKKTNLYPLKLVFMDNNWYVAVLNDDKIEFIRISFIKDLRVTKASFKDIFIGEYLQELKKAQNALTLLPKSKKIAKIKATPNISRYFDKGMKQFLSSQTFIKKEDDGSVIFTLEYTQPLEILPLIQKWLPDLIILGPKDLQQEYIKKMKQSLNNYNTKV